MTAVSRRSFLVQGGAGMAGVASVTAGGIALASGPAGAAEQALDAEELAVLDRPMLLQIRDAAAGEVEILVGDEEIVFTDRALVARVLRASR